jgi:hypothetical protein
VKKIFAIILLFQSLLFGEGEVLAKVKNLIDIETYQTHFKLISKLFVDERRYLKNGKLEVLPILQKLKNEGILNLQLFSPETIEITFKGEGNPTFLIKIASNSLEESGYFKYRISKVKKDKDGFIFSVNFPSAHIPDPTIIGTSLQKRGVKILDVSRANNFSWNYKIDLKNYMEAVLIDWDKKIDLGRPTNDYWLKFEKEGILEIISKGNDWFPEIFLYDENLNLVKVFKKDGKKIKLRLKISNNIKYVKVSDVYHLYNIKNGLSVYFEKIRR